MAAKKRVQHEGTPKTVVIEVGPITHFGTKAEIRASEARLKNDLDALARQYVQVGKRSNVVRTTTQEGWVHL